MTTNEELMEVVPFENLDPCGSLRDSITLLSRLDLLGHVKQDGPNVVIGIREENNVVPYCFGPAWEGNEFYVAANPREWVVEYIMGRYTLQHEPTEEDLWSATEELLRDDGLIEE